MPPRRRWPSSSASTRTTRRWWTGSHLAHRLATSEASLQAARANTAAARAAADAARKTLDDTVLRSPIDGQIARRFAQDGERVNVEAQVAEVVNLSALELQAPLPPRTRCGCRSARRPC
jgi:multidrug resistance efflux pump